MAEQVPPETRTYTPELARLLQRAALINRGYEKEFDLSFTSLLLGFLASDDPLSRWFQGYVQDAGIATDEILATRGLDRATLAEIAARPLPTEPIEPFTQPTSSATTLLSVAEKLRGMVTSPDGPQPLDVRHLMGACIYDPAGHEDPLKRWGFDRQAWSNGFLSQIARLHRAELEGWKEVHRQFFRSEPVVLPGEGPSTHIATDRWTLGDTLGYRVYAHAIYRFLTHPQTKPPLTISIQAPWGGGKTSLMRMIQQALDPDALADTSQAVEQEARRPRSWITIRQLLDEIQAGDETDPAKGLPSLGKLYDHPADEEPRQLTVWFNAWKYQSTNQVWAGLADTIIRQVAARLPPNEREFFWLRLNLRRLDTDRIRRQFYERVLSHWWREARPWILGGAGTVLLSAFITLLGYVTRQDTAQVGGWAALAASALGSAGQFLAKYRAAVRAVEEEPAEISLGEYLDLPDYRSELGFIHHVEADLRRVFDAVPEEYRPIVVFIDDLDRCVPEKVAEVVEAINLFLAGDFPDCMFVLGMDAEMVAAALEAAHADVIARLPADAATPVGWRFMDKFVQLPFIIPPAEEDDLEQYTAALLSADGEPTADPETLRLAREVAERVRTREELNRDTDRLREEHGLSEAQAALLRERVEAQVVRRTLDVGIETFSDRNPEIRRLIRAAAARFSRNPRELKRFVNAFRFQYFLWWARRARGLEAPTLDQLQRWVVLCMKWPEVVRWIRRSGGREQPAAPEEESPPTLTRLRQLEDIGSQATDLAAWHTQARAVLYLTPETTPWLNDDDLRQFFHEEWGYPEGERLSDAAGKGLW